MNIFEEATRNNLRFETNRGLLSVEQLWVMKLISNDGFSLDSVGRAIQKLINEQDQGSLVSSNRITKQEKLNILRLNIIKHIIKVKEDEIELANKELANKEKKQKLLKLLADKQDQKLINMSEEEILKELENI